MCTKYKKDSSCALIPVEEFDIDVMVEMLEDPEGSPYYFIESKYGDLCVGPKTLVQIPNKFLDNNIMREMLLEERSLNSNDFLDATCTRFNIEPTDLGHENPNKKSPYARLTITLKITYSLDRLKKEGLIYCVSRHGDYAIYDLTEKVYDIIKDKKFHRRLVSGDLCNDIVNALRSHPLF